MTIHTVGRELLAPAHHKLIQAQHLAH
eukprot:SAG22_NODE_7814_length_705_cov_1.018152_1_plen_26_part_10